MNDLCRGLYGTSLYDRCVDSVGDGLGIRGRVVAAYPLGVPGYVWVLIIVAAAVAVLCAGWRFLNN